MIEAQVGFKGTLQGVLRFRHQRTSPVPFCPTPKQAGSSICSQRSQCPDLPGSGQGAGVLPPSAEGSARSARRREVAGGHRQASRSTTAARSTGSASGIFYVNLSNLTQTLKPQIEGISYHEGAPGHHSRISFAQEQEKLFLVSRRFRRLYRLCGRGGGFLPEALGKEMGFYQDPSCRLYGNLVAGGMAGRASHRRHWPSCQALEPRARHRLLR